MGKTTLGMNIIERVTKRNQVPALVYSLEMARRQVGLRMLAGYARIDVQKLIRGDMSENEWTAVNSGINDISALPIYVADPSGMSIMELRASARKMVKRCKIGLILIDYMQLLSGGKSENRNAEIGAISRGLKAMAKELNLPVIALAQLSRAVETRKGAKRPMLSDLRESGSIEQDADIVGMIYRPFLYGEKNVIIKNQSTLSEGLAELIIAKHRNGPTGSVWLKFEDQFTRFENFEPVDYYEQGKVKSYDYDHEY
jgi:replicative DNA helicase